LPFFDRLLAAKRQGFNKAKGTNMHLAIFLLTGAIASILICRVLGMRAFQRRVMLPLAIAEQAAFFVGFTLVTYQGKKPLDTFWINANDNVLIAGGDVDMLAMWLLTLVWCGSKWTQVQENTSQFTLGHKLVLIFACIYLDAPILASMLMFESMRVPNPSPPTTTITMYQHEAPKWAMVLGGLITIIQLPIWAYYTYRTTIEMSVNTIEGIFEQFSLDEIHLHHFSMIFILGWYMFPILCTFEWTTRSLLFTTVVRLGLAILFIGNLAAVQYFLQCIFWTVPGRNQTTKKRS
jgi:hypothetical protein